MNVHISEGEIRLELNDIGRMVKLYVEGQLQARAGLGCDGPEDLEAELRKANAARATCDFLDQVIEQVESLDKISDHRIPDSKKETAFAVGFLSGLRGEVQVFDDEPGVEPARVAPEHKLGGPTHNKGWKLGRVILRATKISHGLDDPGW